MSAADPGQPGAWIRSAIARFEGRLVRYAARLTGDVELGRDVTQETFLKLCRESPEQLDGHLAQWLFTVCRRQAIDVRRKEKRMHVLADHAEQVLDRGAESDQAAEQRDSLGSIHRVLSGLSEDQQEVVRLKFQEGLSYREISAITGHSVTNVGYMLHVALKKVREQVRE